jgi:hypothetical protein
MKKALPIIIILVLAVVIGSLSGCSCSTKPSHQSIEGESEKPAGERVTPESGGESEEESLKLSRKMNDDIFVEIQAYGWYYLWLLTKDPIAAQKLENEIDSGELHKKFGVTKEEFEVYAEKIADDPMRYVDLLNRSQERAEELGADLSD